MPLLEVNHNYYDCWVCGIPFALTQSFARAAQQQHKSFYCPNGCRIRFGKSEADKLREELAEARDAQQREREWRQAQERSNTALRGQITKIKKRVGKGVCPCCNRSFENLRRHMENKHPDFADGLTCA